MTYELLVNLEFCTTSFWNNSSIVNRTKSFIAICLHHNMLLPNFSSADVRMYSRPCTYHEQKTYYPLFSYVFTRKIRCELTIYSEAGLFMGSRLFRTLDLTFPDSAKKLTWFLIPRALVLSGPLNLDQRLINWPPDNEMTQTMLLIRVTPLWLRWNYQVNNVSPIKISIYVISTPPFAVNIHTIALGQKSCMASLNNIPA